MTAPPVSPHDAAFEHEVRAMLARRSGDVRPTPATPPADPPTLVRLAVRGASGSGGRRRVVAAAAAVVVLVAGVTGYAATRGLGRSTLQTAAGQGTGVPIVWPLDDHVHADVLATPESAAGAYLSEAVDGVDLSTLEPPVVDGVTASVGYTLHGVPAEVELRLDGDAWGVTGATSDTVDLGILKAVDGDIIAELTLGPAARSGMDVRLSGLSDEGAPTGVLSQFTYVDSGIISVVEGAAPLEHEGDSVVLLPQDPALEHGQAMLAVILDDVNAHRLAGLRLDALADHDGDVSTPDVVIGHATRAVAGSPEGPDDGPGAATPAPMTVPGGPETADSPPNDAVRPADALFVGSGAAAEVAQAYLDDRLPERPNGLRLVPGAGSEQGTGAGEVVDVPWEVVDSDLAGRYSGVIRMRSDPGGWSVVSATTDQISLTVRLADDAVGVTVAWVDPDAYDSVEIDLLDADGFPMTDGEIVSWPTAGEETLVAADEAVDPSEVRSVRVRHVGGTWFSLTEMALP